MATKSDTVGRQMVQNIEAKQPEGKPSRLLETLREHLRDGTATSAPITITSLKRALGSLDDEQLLAVLGQLPAYQLARALAHVLAPVDTTPVPQAQPACSPDEQRQAERAKALRAGKIIYNNKMSVNDCQVRDLSTAGCRVLLESLQGIPNSFTLHILHGDTHHECEVAWRQSNMMGLKFIG